MYVLILSVSKYWVELYNIDFICCGIFTWENNVVLINPYDFSSPILEFWYSQTAASAQNSDGDVWCAHMDKWIIQGISSTSMVLPYSFTNSPIPYLRIDLICYSFCG